MADPRVWGIHGGRTGDAFTLFTDGSVIALGWHLVGDLSDLTNDQAAFKERVAAAFPTKKAAAIPGAAGQLRRFIYDLEVGDIVVFPAKQDWTYRIGRVTGPYTYVPDHESTYPHRRSVEWLRTVPRDSLTKPARFELGAAMSFFRMSHHPHEVFELLKGQELPKHPAEIPDDATDSTDSPTADQIEEATREFVLERLRTLYASHELEEFVADLLTAMGYRAAATQKSGDHGVDVVAGKGALGLDPPILKVQVKSGHGAVGEPPLLQLNGGIAQSQGERGVVVSLGGFTDPARKWAIGKGWFQLIGPGDLVDLVLAHYDELPVEHRENIPLRRVYAPEAAGGTLTWR